MEPGTIIGAIGSSIGTAEKIWNRVKGKLEGLDIEIRHMGYRDVSNWKSVFTVITPYPIAYIGSLQISNGTSQRRGIKKVELSIGGQSFVWDEEDIEPFSPGDVRTVQWLFPASNDSPKHGDFELHITDSSGKLRTIIGRLAENSD